MGKAEPDLAASLEQQDDSAAQLKQLKSLLSQLKESRDNSEQQLENLRSELSILRKKQQNEAEPESPSEEDQKKKEESLELELNDAKKEILRLQQENAELRHSNNNNKDAGTVALSVEDIDDDDEKTQMEHSDDAKKEIRRMKKKINKAVRQVEKLKKIRIFLEHQLEVSRFRENEAVVFLRRFRSFYYMIWRNNVVRGSGGYVANRITLVQHGNNAPAGAADDKELANIDKLMVDSGLLETDEAGKATKDDQQQQTPYKGPSKVAFGKSSVAAEIAKRNAMIRENAPGSRSQAPAPVTPTMAWNKSAAAEGNGMEVPQSPSLGIPLSAIKRPEDAKIVDARQKLEETPAGRYIVLREKHLEAEVTKLSDRAMDLEKELEEERRKNKAPGSDAKLAEEANVLRKMLQSKENDLRIIVGKLRESCIVNWKMEESVKRLEEHILYLEDRLKNYEIRGLPYGEKRRRAWPAYDFLSTLEPTEPKKSARTSLKSVGRGGPDSVIDENPGAATDQETFEQMLARQEEEVGRVHGEESATEDSHGEGFGLRRDHYEMNDLSSSMASSRRYPTRVVAREMRYQGPSPAEEWKRKKEAERIQKGQGASTGAGEGAVEADEDGKPPWMGNRSKETGNKPPWMQGGRGMPNKKVEDDPADAGLPEFMRKFKKIGMKAEEVVVVAQGSSDGTKNARLGMETARPLNRSTIDSANKEDEGEDDESPAPSPAPSPPPSPEPEPVKEPEPEPVEEAEAEPDPAPVPEPEAAPAPAPSPPPAPAAETKSSILDSDSDDSSDSSAAKRKKAAASKPAPTPAPAAETKSSILDSDSDDSSDSSAAKRKKAAASKPAPTSASASGKASFLDSDSDDSSDSSAAKRKEAAPSKPTPKGSFLDSDSDSDDSS